MAESSSIPALAGLASGQAAEYGSKAANLGILSRANFPVPHGIAIGKTIFEHYLVLMGIDIQALRSLGAVGLSDLESSLTQLEMSRQRILDTLATHAIPSELSEPILGAIRDQLDIDAGVAVRSSCTAEDLSNASFAGQYLSVLDCRSESDVLNAVRACWASQYEERVLEYSVSRRGVPIVTPSMGVIIQNMVQADFAGVCFTRGPTRRTANHIIVEAVRGKGNLLVDGSRTPWHFEFEQSGKLRNRIPPTQPMDEPDLSDIIHVANLCRRIEATFGAPQDVEWALIDSQAYILQTRPITSLPDMPRAIPAFASPDFKELASNASSFNEIPVLSDLISLDMALIRGASQLISAQLPTGEWPVPGQPEWNDVATARIYRLLTKGGIPPNMRWTIPMSNGTTRRGGLDVAYSYLIRRLLQDTPPGQDIWDTCNIVRAAMLNPRQESAEACGRSLSMISKAVDNGFQGMESTEWYGSGFLAAALELYLDLRDEARAYACAVQLMSHDGLIAASTPGDDRSAERVPAEWHVAQAVSALVRFRTEYDAVPPELGEVIKASTSWLLSRQNPDGSWGPSNNPYSSYNVYFTSYALMALHVSTPTAREVVNRGEQWIRNRQFRSGAFGDIASSEMAMEYFQLRYGPQFAIMVPLPTLNQLFSIASKVSQGLS